MANEEQLSILKQGADVWNKWRKKHTSTEPNFESADLIDFNLCDVNFKNTNLSGAALTRSNLIGADLSYANLYFSNLNSANLSFANLSHANLENSVLYNTLFTHAVLDWVNLRKASLYMTIFSDCDLTNIDTLKQCKPQGPCVIDIATLSKSKNVPIKFLRDCGLPDFIIDALPTLQKIENQYQSCFISYSNHDEGIAKRLNNDLQDNGVRCWFAPEDMKIGDEIRLTIDQQIRLRDKLLVILSENSVQSEWVGDEVEAALEEEKESGRMILFPIRLDDAVMDTRDDWAAKIKRRRHIGDFSNWKDEGSYRKAFEKLLRDLKAGSV